MVMPYERRPCGHVKLYPRLPATDVPFVWVMFAVTGPEEAVTVADGAAETMVEVTVLPTDVAGPTTTEEEAGREVDDPAAEEAEEDRQELSEEDMMTRGAA